MAPAAPTRPLADLVEWLRKHGVDHEIHEHPETFTAASTARSEGVDPRSFAKVVGVSTEDGRMALLVVDARRRVDLQKARGVLGAVDVRLLDEPELAALAPGCEPGAIPAVGALFDLPMYVDDAIEEDAEISFNGGTHRSSVRVDRAAWEQAAAVRYADLVVDTDDEPAWARS
jgi:Ala-tRNA(Pro) deacylase